MSTSNKRLNGYLRCFRIKKTPYCKYVYRKTAVMYRLSCSGNESCNGSRSCVAIGKSVGSGVGNDNGNGVGVGVGSGCWQSHVAAISIYSIDSSRRNTSCFTANTTSHPVHTSNLGKVGTIPHTTPACQRPLICQLLPTPIHNNRNYIDKFESSYMGA
jgi:hypothetical protein